MINFNKRMCEQKVEGCKILMRGTKTEVKGIREGGVRH